MSDITCGNYDGEIHVIKLHKGHLIYFKIINIATKQIFVMDILVSVTKLLSF
jgi:hypothetical protein